MFKKIIIALGMVVLSSYVSSSRLRDGYGPTNVVSSNSYAIGDANALLGTALSSHTAGSNANLATSNIQGALKVANCQGATQLNNIKLP